MGENAPAAHLYGLHLRPYELGQMEFGNLNLGTDSPGMELVHLVGTMDQSVNLLLTHDDIKGLSEAAMTTASSRTCATLLA